MKAHFIFILWLVATISAASSQPSLSSNEMLPPGSSLEFQQIENLSAIDTSIQGPDATWNFSNLEDSPTTDTQTLEILEVEGTPYASSFPQANYVQKEDLPGTTRYSYFNINNLRFQRLGSGSEGSPLNIYSNPQIEIIYPLALGSVSNDEWNNSESMFAGEYNLKCVGYGTLVLPSATYEDALMVRVKLVGAGTTPVYIWYSSDNGAVLLQYVAGTGLFIPMFGIYASALTVGIDKSRPMPGLAYNNPVYNQLRIHFHAPAIHHMNYRVVNNRGRQIDQNQTAINPESRNHLTLDFTDYPSGMYLVMFTGHAYPGIKKVIKVVKR